MSDFISQTTSEGYRQSRRSFLGKFATTALTVPLLPTALVDGKQISVMRNQMIPTMTGPVPTDKLGTTLIHEHVLWGPIPDEARGRSVEIAVGYLEEAAR